MGMFTKPFWVAALERAVRTGAATALGVLGAQSVITEVHAGAIFSAVGVAALLDLLTSIAGSSPALPGDGPSLTTAEEVVEEEPA